jgi:hypothetical protein
MKLLVMILCFCSINFSNDFIQQARNSLIQQIYYRYNVEKSNPKYLVAIRNIYNENYVNGTYQANMDIDWIQNFGSKRFLRGFREKGITIRGKADNNQGQPMISFVAVTYVAQGDIFTLKMNTIEKDVDDTIVNELPHGTIGISPPDFLEKSK